MPQEAWYVLIIAVLVAVVFAIRWGANLRITRDSIEVSKGATPPETRPRISVADGATLRGVTAGDIGGVIVKGGSPLPSLEADVSVLSKAKLEDARVGDIAAVKHHSDSER